MTVYAVWVSHGGGDSDLVALLTSEVEATKFMELWKADHSGDYDVVDTPVHESHRDALDW